MWENPNPTASFSAQDIALSDTDYDYLLIITKATSTSVYTESDFCVKGSSIIITSFSTSNNREIRRTFGSNANGDSITISNGIIQNVGSETQSNDNNRLVPFKILGFKY